MRRGTFAFTLLALFIAEQRAAEIEGDLIEEGEYHGRSWFIIHVIGTTLALFKESFKQAPFRITVLGFFATGLSVVICGFVDRVFFAPGAFFPAPLIGFIVIPTSAFLTGFGLGYFGAGLGIRATTVSMALLTLLFIVTQATSGLARLSVPLAILLAIGSFALSIVIFLAPLMTGGVCGYRRAVDRY